MSVNDCANYMIDLLIKANAESRQLDYITPLEKIRKCLVLYNQGCIDEIKAKQIIINPFKNHDIV